MTAPRGIRNNNPGNIRYVEGVTSTYQGCVGQDDAGFCRFDTPENGLRALCRLLLVYRDRHSLTTVNGILHRWAPPSDNNDTAAYVRAVCAEMGVARDAELPLHEPGMLALLATAITRHENGQQPYPADLIVGAAHAALGMPAPAAIPAAGEAQRTSEPPAPQHAPIEERGIP